jgi:hypothetical protein
VDNGPIFPITLIEGSGVFLPFSGEKGVFSGTEMRSIMFDISESGKEAVISYLNKIRKDRRIMKSASKSYENEFDKPLKNYKLQNLILTKSLIVKL